MNGRCVNLLIVIKYFLEIIRMWGGGLFESQPFLTEMLMIKVIFDFITYVPFGTGSPYFFNRKQCYFHKMKLLIMGARLTVW